MMLHWIGWALLVLFAIAAFAVAGYAGYLVVKAVHGDGSGGQTIGWALFMVVLTAGWCLVAAAAGAGAAIAAYNWRPWC